MHIKITFLGATKSVTGSRHLIEANGLKFLVDCGLYQERELRVRNWEPFFYPPANIDAVLLTHAHLDHSGFLPRFVNNGFKGRVYCTAPTADITQVMLLDSARIQEQDAEAKKRRHEREGRKGPYPEVPLYTDADAKACFPLLAPVPYGKVTELGNGITFTFFDAGHVLGSGMIEIKVRQNSEERTLLFSGDIGRTNRPILQNPTFFDKADYVVMESTYADSILPDPERMLDKFVEVILSTVEGGGNIIIPSFALERAQDVLYYLSQATFAGQLPPLQVYLDSPMAVNITDIYERHSSLMDDEAKRLIREKKSPFDFPGLHYVSSVDDSRQIEQLTEPAIIIAGAGMCTGGRIKYHLVSNITRQESTILFVGYQAVGTLGRIIVDGAKEVRILGKKYPVKAQILHMNGFSSHADAVQLTRWIYNLKSPPRHVYVVHGEENAANHLASTIENEKNWSATVPEYQDQFILD
jgi:metallo-beta-lactamase family protein